METIMALAHRHGLTVVEDNAHGLFGKYKGGELGTFGCLAALSFHETKNFTCGEGGALVINNPSYVDRAEVIREKGTNRNRFFRGQVDKYTWVDRGSSYLPSDILAAFLYAQLEAHEKVQEKRRWVWSYYAEHLSDWAQANGARLPVVPPWCEHPSHLFYLLLPNMEHRQGLIAHLKAHGILSVFHYQPLHLSPMGRQFGYRSGHCPVTERVSNCLVRLPFYNDLTTGDLELIVETIRGFKPS
jgi:dTDP-4-amino-4,6-dideoxygalactose transaminase